MIPLLMSIILKLLKILLAYSLCTLFSGFFVALYYFYPELLKVPRSDTFGEQAFLGYFFISMMIAEFAALPALLAVTVAEYRAIRTKPYYMAVATLIGASLPFIFFGIFGGGREPYMGLIIVGIILGPFAGMIYWFIAGKSAGLISPLASHLRGPDAP